MQRISQKQSWHTNTVKMPNNEFKKALLKIPTRTKLRLEDVLWTCLKDVLWTFPYGPLCNAKGCPLPTS